MKFSQFEYKRPDIDKVKTDFNTLIEQFSGASSVDAQNEIMQKFNDLRMEFSTMSTLASIKYSVNSLDKELESEQDFFDQNWPDIEGLEAKYYNAILNSKFRKELEEKWGTHLFDLAGEIIKTFKPEILDELKKENQLRTDYSKLLASAKIMFEGEERNLSGLTPFMESPDREMRKRASEARWKFVEDNSEEFDRLYDELVKIRHSIALKLGYENFIPVGYARMRRTDYNSKMVADFRKQVEKFIVPIAKELFEKQRERLGLDSLKYYDLPIEYKDGNAKPHGNPEWIVSCATRMYSELSAETKEFFDFMVNNELMDLVNKEGKQPGGYCTFIEKHKSPFIFSNFNGTMGDVEVLTHEAGHAFQVYSSRNFDIPEYFFPTSEACEIHSMSMEFLTWPWMSCFFKDQTEKFKYTHLKGSLIFIPYGVSVDEFQHYVYENPMDTPQQRKTAWASIQKKYQPYIDYSDNEFLENGGRWQLQSHIYTTPFYYIDYCLAQICAFQFWKRSKDGDTKALNDYISLCKAGGSQSFLQLVKLANLISPFKEGCIESFVTDVESWLSNFNNGQPAFSAN